LARVRKILLIALLFSLVSFNRGAEENRIVFVDKLVPRNMRLTNSDSSDLGNPAIDKTVNSFLRKWSIAGASVAISKDGKLVFAKGFGFADTSEKKETQPYNQFRIASISIRKTRGSIV
jgi:CubicO group peptidase (beta-lactamase class C family)